VCEILEKTGVDMNEKKKKPLPASIRRYLERRPKTKTEFNEYGVFIYFDEDNHQEEKPQEEANHEPAEETDTKAI